MSGATTQTPEYQAYLRARDAVLRMKGVRQADAVAQPSAYWLDELENIDYLIDASPLIVRKLRQHAFHITGIRPYDYRTKEDGRRQGFEARLRALRAIGGDELLVPENPALGGFGYEIDGRLYNVDTLKYYEVLIGMRRGGVLDHLRGVDRPTVCEIGAGWAGFAYQFKQLFPRSTYVIVDFPELFLFSATYLGAIFPDASLLFVTDSNDLRSWQTADFVFVPNTLASTVSVLPLDLTLNMVSFQEMTDAQVREYARTAAASGCPLLYSLNRERSPYNTELLSVTDALGEYYRMTEVSVLDTDYTSAMKKPPKPGRIAERSEFSYRHQVGRLDAAARRGVPARTTASTATTGARVVLGMTAHNNARHLASAVESLLAQTYADFVLVILDDASTDETEAIARGYAAQDTRVRYFRHAERQAMIATWRDVVEIAGRECPSAEHFAWTSDHDRWHPEWLARLVAVLDDDPDTVLAYPITRRITEHGQELDKGPRLFDTSGCRTLEERWRALCDEGVGAGDMVYGLMRFTALRRAGVFRYVLRPDRLLIAELTLQGVIRQVPEVLWFRRQSSASSVERQHRTLVLDGQRPPGFSLPPWLQHSRLLWREYAVREPCPLPLTRSDWMRMLLRYQLRYGWRHFRKSPGSHALARGISRAIFTRKLLKHYFHHAVYHTLVGARTFRGKVRRAGRRAVYEVLMFARRIGLRGSGETSSQKGT